MNRVATVVPRTPTSATSSILMSSPSTNSEAIFQVKQEDIEYQLLSPISASSPMHHGLGGNRGGHGMHHTKIIKVRYHSIFFVRVGRPGVGHKTTCASSEYHHFFHYIMSSSDLPKLLRTSPKMAKFFKVIFLVLKIADKWFFLKFFIFKMLCFSNQGDSHRGGPEVDSGHVPDVEQRKRSWVLFYAHHALHGVSHAHQSYIHDALRK